MIYKIWVFILILAASAVFAQTPTPAAVNGVFGQGEKLEIPKTVSRLHYLIIVIASLIATVSAFGCVLFFLTVKRKQPAIPAEDTAVVKTEVDLSPREREIFNYLLTELSTKEIAQKMKLTYSGVNFHIQNLYRKLRLQSRAELLAKYVSKPDKE